MIRSLSILCVVLGLAIAGPAAADTFLNGDFEGSTTIFGGESPTKGWFKLGQTGVTTGPASPDPTVEPDFKPSGSAPVPLAGSVSMWTAIDSSITATSHVTTGSAEWDAFWVDFSGDAVVGFGGGDGTDAFKSLLRTGGTSEVSMTTGDMVVSMTKFHFDHTSGITDAISAIARWFSDEISGDAYLFIFIVDDLDAAIEASLFIHSIDATTASSEVGPFGEFDFRSKSITISGAIPAATHDGTFTFFVGIAQESDGALFDVSGIWDSFSPSSPGTPTPEPGSMALMAILGAAACFGRRRMQVEQEDAA